MNFIHRFSFIFIRYAFPAIIIATLAGCSAYDSSSMSNSKNEKSASGKFTIAQHVTPPADIQSLQLYAGDSPETPPIIKLGESGLTLSFDYLGSKARQFKLSVSHRSRDWEESPIGPNTYLSGFFETTFGGGEKSFTQNPGYYHFSYAFPNKRFQITKSGNYLLSVVDYNTNKLLFRIPFFVTESEGSLQTRIEPLYTERDDGRTVAQPFSTYQYPDFVKQPQFDLSFTYVQNQFWGRARSTDLFDTASPGEVNFHLARGQSFIANYEFNILDLRSFPADGQQIVELQPGKTPPVVRLRRDVQQFNETTGRFPDRETGLPPDDRSAQYASVIFSLEADESIRPHDSIYLVGDFNNWVISGKNRMRYDSTQQLWTGKALIKQGIYNYKYVHVVNNEIDDMALDRSFTDSEQEYLTFVYFLDPTLRFYRLLHVDRLVQ